MLCYPPLAMHHQSAQAVLRLTLCLLAWGIAPHLHAADYEEEPNYVRLDLGIRYTTLFNKDTLDQRSSVFGYKAMGLFSAGIADTAAGAWTLRGMGGYGLSLYLVA